MANIKKITLPSGTTYDIVDAGARELIAALDGSTAFLGVTTTELTDGATTTPITINGASVDAVTGGIVSYGSKEFVWNGSAWQEFGDLSALGTLAYKDSATTTYTPAGSVSQPTFSGTADTVSVTGTPSGDVEITATDNTNGNYQPKGTVSTPTISVKTAGTTTTVNSITAVGTLPELTTTVANETLTIGFSQGTLPTKGANTTVKTGDAAYESTQPTFTGTKAQISGSFDGDSLTSTGSYTPAGTVSKPSFTGTQATIEVS